MSIAEGLAAVEARVRAASTAAGRPADDVAVLLAVKTQPVATVLDALRAGATILGHNRAQELVAGAPGLADAPAHEMHFIGHLQSNKVNQVLRHSSCVQTVDSARLADRLDTATARRRADGVATGPLDVFVQVNTSGEPAKHGVPPEQAADLAAAVGAADNLHLRGLMTVGAHSPDVGLVRASYERLTAVRDTVLAGDAPGTADARELSMGMSGDLEVAIAAGATMVRVGTAVFGQRPAG